MKIENKANRIVDNFSLEIAGGKPQTAVRWPELLITQLLITDNRTNKLLIPAQISAKTTRKTKYPIPREYLITRAHPIPRQYPIARHHPRNPTTLMM
jgi:hypothetical protein